MSGQRDHWRRNSYRKRSSSQERRRLQDRRRRQHEEVDDFRRAQSYKGWLNSIQRRYFDSYRPQGHRRTDIPEHTKSS